MSGAGICQAVAARVLIDHWAGLLAVRVSLDQGMAQLTTGQWLRFLARRAHDARARPSGTVNYAAEPWSADRGRVGGNRGCRRRTHHREILSWGLSGIAQVAVVASSEADLAGGTSYACCVRSPVHLAVRGGRAPGALPERSDALTTLSKVGERLAACCLGCRGYPNSHYQQTDR